MRGADWLWKVALVPFRVSAARARCAVGTGGDAT